MSKYPNLLIGAALAAGLGATPALAEKLGLGRPALPDEIAAWNLDVSPDGTGLPAGSGSVEDGETLFSDYCAVCHGEFAEGVDNWPKLSGGEDTLDHEDPLKTVGSYWPYLSTAWDYIHRSMPFGNAQSLEVDEVYAVVAYILYSNDMVEDDFVLSNENFLDVEMTNTNGFIVDDRAETEYAQFSQEVCMADCKDTVEITMRAAVLDVTPEETRARQIQEMVEATNPRARPAATPETPATPAAPVAQEPAAPAAVVEETVALDPELVAKGEKLFKKCKACHQVGDGATNRTGPHLNDVMGRAAGGIEGFRYSKPMIAAGEDGLLWDEASLAEFLTKPRAMIKGTKMSFAGFKKEKDINAMIEYLKSFAQ